MTNLVYSIDLMQCSSWVLTFKISDGSSKNIDCTVSCQTSWESNVETD